MGKTEVSTSVVEWSESLGDNVPIIIRIHTRTDQKTFSACMAVSSITFFHIILVLFLTLYIRFYVLFAYT